MWAVSGALRNRAERRVVRRVCVAMMCSFRMVGMASVR